MLKWSACSHIFSNKSHQWGLACITKCKNPWWFKPPVPSSREETSWALFLSAFSPSISLCPVKVKGNEGRKKRRKKERKEGGTEGKRKGGKKGRMEEGKRLSAWTVDLSSFVIGYWAPEVTLVVNKWTKNKQTKMKTNKRTVWEFLNAKSKPKINTSIDI